jgi:4-carboxymuconolactone decarboxylase
MPRVTPVASKADVAPEHQAVVDDVLKVFGAVRGPFSMMLHSPEMTKRMLPLVPFFRDESVVEGKLRSVGILAAVREREAAYVWAAQVAAARRNGLREEAIDLLRAKADASKFPAEEAAIVTYVRQLMRTNRAEQAAFDALHKKYGTKWLVELTAGVHYYAMLCGVVNAFEVAAPPDGDKLPGVRALREGNHDHLHRRWHRVHRETARSAPGATRRRDRLHGYQPADRRFRPAWQTGEGGAGRCQSVR